MTLTHGENEMTISTIDNSQRTAAKVAGWSGLLTFAIVVLGNYVLLNPLVVPGDAAATAQNVVAHQMQFRITVVCFLTYSLGVVVLLSALYVVLEPVNGGLALVGALFRLIFALLWLLSPLNLLAMLRLLSNANYLQVIEPDRLQALARLHLGATFDDYYVGLPFFGPRGLTIFGIIASVWCVICAFVYLVFPDFAKPVNPYWFDSPMAIFEMVLSFWLLFNGLKQPEIAAT